MGRRLQRNEWAFLLKTVFRQHENVADNGLITYGPLSRERLREATGLTASQVDAAIAYWKDAVAQSDIWAVISGRDGVALTNDPAKILTFLVTRLSGVSTALRRLKTGTVDQLVKLPVDDQLKTPLRHISMQFDHLIESINYLARSASNAAAEIPSDVPAAVPVAEEVEA